MRLRSQVGGTAGCRGLESPRVSSDRLANGHLHRKEPGSCKSPIRRSRLPGRVLNAYMDGDDVVAVIRSGGIVRDLRFRAEHSCFLRDVEPELRTMLSRHDSVVSLSDEGEWIRVRWANRAACIYYSQGLENVGVKTYEAAIRPELRWMADNDVWVSAPSIAWLDLETDSRIPFSRKEEMRILCWSVVDEKGHKFEGVLRDDSDRAERDLLNELFDRLRWYDLILAWNGDRFDFPVLRARTFRFGVPVELRRWLWLDAMLLFKRMNIMAAESGDEKSSYALDAIASAVLGEGKAPLDASRSWQYWENGGEDRAALVAYCVRDAELMVRIEEVTGYVQLLLALSDLCGSFPDTRGLHPSAQAESFLQRLALRRGVKFKSSFRDSRGEVVAFKGAYVMEPTVKGIVKGVHVGDFSSLYPSIIRAWNMSPETRLEMRSKDQRYSFSELTGAMFSVDEEGLLPAAVAELMELRKKWNDKKASASPGTVEWKEADRRSTATKIAANSFYGVMGLPVSRFYDPILAEAVTQCGVWLLKRTIKEAKSKGINVVYGDTDSVCVAGTTRQEFEDFVKWCNSSLYPSMLRKVGCIDENLIHLAYEKEFERIVFVRAKRYVGKYRHFKGTLARKDSKPEVKGLEYKRGDSIQLARALQAEAIEMLVGSDPTEEPKDYQEFIARWRRRVFEDSLSLQDVVIRKSLAKNLREYVRKKKKDGTWARQQPHIEVARLMKQKGYDVAEGAKISYVVTDGSAKPMKFVPAEDWNGSVDRESLWASQVYPPTLRLLEAAFPENDWSHLAGPTTGFGKQQFLFEE